MVPVVYLAMMRSHQWLSEPDIATVLDEYTSVWPEAVVDYKQSELIDVTSQMWPEAQYLWMVRNPADTVASMVKRGWYKPSDDDYPPGYLLIWRRDERLMQQTATNDSGNRTRGDFVGEFTSAEWAQMNQVERCGWWWSYCNRAIAAQVSRLDRSRWQMVRLEDVGPWFAEQLTGEAREFPHQNQSEAEPVTGWEPFVQEMAGVLGYDI